MTLVHITTVPFYVSIHFSFSDVITGYKRFFRYVNCYDIYTYIKIFLRLFYRCVNCYGLGIAGADISMNVSMTYLICTILGWG